MRRAVPALAVLVAIGVIGCGGGGGSRGTVVGGTNGGADTGSTVLTTGSMTTGEVTTGTTATSTTAAVGPTTGSVTTGNTATSGTSGGGTTSGASGTTGSTTTMGPVSATTGTTSAPGGTTGSTMPPSTTTGGATNGTGTTTGTSAPITAPPSSLRPNAIYFGHFYGDASVVTSLLSDGSERQDAAGGADGVVGAFPDPDQAGMTIYALLINGLYGVYSGATFDPSTATRLVAPAYDAVTGLQPTTNGDVLLVASTGGTSRAYLLSGGAVQTIDEADSASISLDGTKVVYTKLVGDLNQMFVWTRATRSSQALAPGTDALFPTFSRDGAWVLFSSDRDGTSDTPWDLYQVPTVGGTLDRITNTPDVNEFGASYNEARTMIAFIGQALDPNDNGVYVWSNAGHTRIATDADVAFATYWTTSAGRSIGGVRGARFQRLKLSKRR